MTMMSWSHLSLLLLLNLLDCFCDLTTRDDQILNSTLVTASPTDLPSSISHQSLETTSLPASSSDVTVLPSSVLNTRPFTLTTKARDSSPATELPSSTTFAPSASGLIPVKKEDSSSTQELATHLSTLDARGFEVTAMVTTPSSIQPSSNVPIGQEETTITRQEGDKETTSSKVTSVITTTSTKPSDQVSQTPSTSTISSTDTLIQDKDNNLLIILVVVILVVTLLIALILLWRRRQKRRTGALMLVGSGKQKGAGDAWAGPVQVVEDQATPGSAAVEAGTGNSEGEGTGRRPTLTTFFGKRKSRQGSLMLEDLETGAVTNNLKDESEPLVENTDGAVKPTEADESGANGLAAGDGNLPSAPVAKV